jgi:phage baseplate assembly protein gpV
MAVEGALQYIPGAKASADLSAKQFFVMKISGNSTVTVGAAATDVPCGILQDAPVSGAPAAVAFAGVSTAVAGGTVAAGDVVGMDANGKVVTYVPGTDTTKYMVGKALTGGASGETISILLSLGGRLA